MRCGQCGRLKITECCVGVLENVSLAFMTPQMHTHIIHTRTPVDTTSCWRLARITLLTLQRHEHERTGHTVQQYDQKQEAMREPLARPPAELLVDVEGALLADVQAGLGRCERKVLEALELLEHEAGGGRLVCNAAERICVR